MLDLEIERIRSISDGYQVLVTISDEIQEILHPAVEGMEATHPDEGDAMYLLGRMVVAVEHLAKRLDDFESGGRPERS